MYGEYWILRIVIGSLEILKILLGRKLDDKRNLESVDNGNKLKIYFKCGVNFI